MKGKSRKIIAGLLVGFGLAVLGSITVPLGIELVKLSLEPRIIDPTAMGAAPKTYVVNVLGLTTTDYTYAANWFPVAGAAQPVDSKVSHFTVSVPSIDLVDVPVEVNGTDLKKNAIHYPGTALPGKSGNSVIFGHSALPQFYRKGNPLTIFNPLLKVKVGDEVTVKFDGVTYTYVVRQIKEVKPDQVDVLSQDESKNELTLITCTPLGTYWRRFVARAELVP